jgi:hypothetical protein
MNMMIVPNPHGFTRSPKFPKVLLFSSPQTYIWGTELFIIETSLESNIGLNSVFLDGTWKKHNSINFA